MREQQPPLDADAFDAEATRHRSRNSSWRFCLEGYPPDGGGGFVRAYRSMRHARRGLRQWKRAFPEDYWRIRRYLSTRPPTTRRVNVPAQSAATDAGRDAQTKGPYPLSAFPSDGA